MYIKRYSITALLLIIAVGWAVYGLVTQESHHLSLFGVELPALPIAVWISLAMGLLFAATLAHMIFYSLVDTLRLRRYEKDYAQLIEAVGDAFLQKAQRERSYKTERYRILGSIVEQSDMIPHDSLASIENAKLAGIIEAVQKIGNGETADIKRYNLPQTNPLVVRNQRNRFEEGKLDPEAVLSKPDTYTPELCHLAYEKICDTAQMHVIEKYRNFMTFTAFRKLLNRINAEENTLHIPNATIVDFVGKIKDLKPLDYLFLSLQCTRNMLPEQRMSVFEELSDEDDKALDALLFTLFDLEMTDKAHEILSLTAEEEYMLFKAYTDLKSCGKNYDIKMFARMMLQNYTPRV